MHYSAPQPPSWNGASLRSAHNTTNYSFTPLYGKILDPPLNTDHKSACTYHFAAYDKRLYPNQLHPLVDYMITSQNTLHSVQTYLHVKSANGAVYCVRLRVSCYHCIMTQYTYYPGCIESVTYYASNLKNKRHYESISGCLCGSVEVAACMVLIFSSSFKICIILSVCFVSR